MKASVFRKERFNSAHRLFNPDWSEEKNNEIFGLCNNPNYHGHNYILVVKVTGDIDPETGYVIDMKQLKSVIKDNIIEKFDHRNLNLDVAEFTNLNPTAENIVVVIWNILRKKLDTKYQLHVRLYETERNFVEYDGNV